MACSKNGCSGCSGCNNFGVLNSVVGPLTNCGCGCGSNSWYYRDFPFYTGPCGPCVYDETCAGRKCRKYGSWGYGNWNNWNNGKCGYCGGNWNNGRCDSCGYSWNNWNNWNYNRCSYCGGSGCSHCGYATVSSCASHLSTTSCHFSASAPLIVPAGNHVALTASPDTHDCFRCSEDGILIRQPGTYMAIHTTHVPAMQELFSRMFLTLNGEVLEESRQDVAAKADCTSNASSSHLIFNAQPNSTLCLVSSEDISLANCQDSSDVFKLTLIKLN